MIDHTETDVSKGKTTASLGGKKCCEVEGCQSIIKDDYTQEDPDLIDSLGVNFT